MKKDKRLMEASCWERLTEGETGWAGPCSINLQSNFLLTGGLCSCPVIYLGPNYGGGNEDTGDLLQKVPCTHCYTQ